MAFILDVLLKNFFTMSELKRQKLTEKKDTFVYFIDMRNAFYCVDRNLLLTSS